MTHFSKKGITLLVLLFALGFLSVFLSRNGRLYIKNSLVVDDPVEVLIYDTENLEGLSEQLDSLDIRYNREELRWAATTLGWRNFRAGRYLLSESQSYSSFFSKLGRGIQDPTQVTVLPGTDMNRLSERLSEQLRPDSLSFRQIFEDSSEVAMELSLSGEQLFARMLPETYEMYWTSTAAGAIRRIHSAFEQRVIEPNRGEIEEHPLGLNEIVVLASIVEWEARHDEEKPKISGLYMNRLDRNMLLQADPTVLYALGEKRRLLFEDYQLDHPYNTYQVSGLPPGPITNPDLQSIRAVLRPEEHDFLYMVATPDGSHQFSETFQEHQQASEEWRRWIREQYRIQREREGGSE